ncbi:MAG: vitamin B12-dependent ribonucleotide reductase [Candidatus Paceibacterota bacterium]
MPSQNLPVADKKKSVLEKSLNLKRFFSKSETYPFEEVSWVRRDAAVGSGEKKAFEQRGVEFPEFWSENAVNITASKYFRGKLGTPERERSAKEMISRVVKTIRGWGESSGYFSGSEEAAIFESELAHLILFQKGSFNSPVWFNVGRVERPQCSACFILSVKDDMGSILDWVKNEGVIFKGGSGAGINLSPLRSKYELLSAGGRASGPVSFMRGADSVAGMIKSGGTTRRAAKMVVLNDKHPDILDFIRCKAEEEKKIRALAEAGYNMADLNNEAWYSIQFQNANNSVRLSDDFMKKVEKDGDWQTEFVNGGGAAETHKAKDVLMEVAKAAWACGDPGVQFDTTINDWHTCPVSGRINASNPCSEYMHLDDSACNLASLNIMKFLEDDGSFKVKEFKHAVDILILAQEIIVGHSSYPTEKITENAKNFRQLGLGYANIGAALMSKGLAYDSEEGRAFVSSVTSLLTGEAYRFSAEISALTGPFTGYEKNKDAMLYVIEKHRDASRRVNVSLLNDPNLSAEALKVWDEALELGRKNGFRNSQVSVLAPTGTISFMMDCDTTGIEPEFSLVKMKQLVGGGWMKLVNQGVKNALLNLNYSEIEAGEIVSFIEKNNTIEGAPFLKEEHLSIFDCAVKPANGSRSISWRGHVKMVAAAQPFISGAISKTFNMDSSATVEEIYDAYLMAWKLGIKAFAVYRDGSKSTQPLNTSKPKEKESEQKENISESKPFRRRLPKTRPSETHKFSIAGHEGYLTYSMYEDGAPAEIFIRMAKQGSTLSGLLDAFAITISMSLQYGVPLKDLTHKFIHSRFEPAGFTDNPEIKIATSIIDYIFRYLALRFLSPEELFEFGLSPSASYLASISKDAASVPSVAEIKEAKNEEIRTVSYSSPLKNGQVFSGTVCKKCGGMMVRTGTCQTCLECGESSGGCS